MMKTLIKVLLFLLIVVLVLVLIAAFFLTGPYTDILWLNSVHYLFVALNMILVRLVAFFLPFFLSFIVLGIGYELNKINPFRPLPFWMTIFISVAWGVFGLVEWKVFLFHPGFVKDFTGFIDPLFHLPEGFYLYWLPFFKFISLEILSLFLILLFISVSKGGLSIESSKIRLKLLPLFFISLIVLSGLILLILGLLNRLTLENHPRLGIDFIAYYGNMLGMGIWSGITLIVLIISLIQLGFGLKLKTFFWRSLLIGLAYPLLTLFYPFILKEIRLKPNEVVLQKPFVERRISSTLAGYGIHLRSIEFTRYKNAAEGIQDAAGTLRIWDSDTYMRVIDQLESYRTYFDFNDVDTAAYEVSNDLVQVALSARELNSSRLPPEAQSWDNIHLRYTHGFGLVLSPSHSSDSEGKPIFWIQGLQNETSLSNLRVEQPRLYYGEESSNYVIVHTKAEEFDYTASSNRFTSNYELTNGIPIGSFLNRLVYSIVFRDKNIFLSQYITKDSILFYRRQVLERLNYIFPLLNYDPDPVLSIVNGELYWVIDAYTTTDRFPLSERSQTRFGKLNYIRNSARALINAYSGEVKFYLTDKTDIIALNYQALFPGLFQKEIPPEVSARFRYPYNLLDIQSPIFCRYHVQSPESFYNSEDVWDIPRQIYGEKPTNFAPYYLLLRFQDSEIEPRRNFSVVQPFSPHGRENLAGWLIGYYSGSNQIALQYAGMHENALGPMQIDSRINQDDRLSSLFSLWSLKGSRIVRGNTKFIPVGNDLLYVKPIFIESETLSIPQLVRLAAVYQDSVFLGASSPELIQNIKSEIQNTNP